MSGLFDSYTLKDVTLRNRIAVAPMCQYMANDGLAGDWHKVHYASLARGGAGLVVVEATAVSPEGRISWADLGLWNDEQARELAERLMTEPMLRALPDVQAVATLLAQALAGTASDAPAAPTIAVRVPGAAADSRRRGPQHLPHAA